MRSLVNAVVIIIGVSSGGQALAGRPKPAAPAQPVAAIQKNEVPAFEAKVKALAGPDVKVTLKFAYEAPEKADSYPIKDSGAYLARGVADHLLTKNMFDPVTDALKTVMADELGKRAIKDNLKQIVIYTVVSDARLSFADGLLSVGNHIYSDGEGSRNGAAEIAKMLEWTLKIDEPRVGSKVVLGHARAIEQMETEEVAPFRERVKATCKCSPKITMRYDAPSVDPGASQADPGMFLHRAVMLGHQSLTRSMLNPLNDGLAQAAADPVGAKVLADQLKEIVIYAIVQDAKLSFSDGVLTVGNYILGDGYGSAWSAKDFKKALLGKKQAD